MIIVAYCTSWCSEARSEITATWEGLKKNKKDRNGKSNSVNHDWSFWPKVKTSLYYAWGIKGDLN